MWIPRFVRSVVAPGLVAGLLAGCVVNDRAAAIGHDFTDIVRAHVMAGTGFDVKLEATTFIGLGLGGYDADAWGIGDRYVGGWHERVSDLGVLFMNTHYEATQGVPRVSGEHFFQFWNAFSGPEPVYATTQPRRADWFTLRATVFCFVGFDIELRLGEVIDLLMCPFGGDPSGDDGPWPPPASPPLKIVHT